VIRSYDLSKLVLELVSYAILHNANPKHLGKYIRIASNSTVKTSTQTIPVTNRASLCVTLFDMAKEFFAQPRDIFCNCSPRNQPRRTLRTKGLFAEDMGYRVSQHHIVSDFPDRQIQIASHYGFHPYSHLRHHKAHPSRTHRCLSTAILQPL